MPQFHTSSFLPLSRVSAVALLLGLAACNGQQGAGGGAPGRGPQETPVRVAAVTRQTVPVQLTAIGNVEAYATVSVKAQVSGEITEVHFAEGDFVKKDQVLFSIDARPYEVALRQAEANLARSLAQKDQATASRARDAAQARNARSELERNRPLLEKRMVSQEEFDQVTANADALNAAVAADEAAIKAAEKAFQAAEADIDEAELYLEYCTIRSPMDGRTGSLLIHKGNLVRANDTNPLVVINQVQPIYVSFTLPEKHLAEIREFMAKGPLEVTAAVTEGEESPAAGVLSFVDNTINEMTGTIRLKATFQNTDLHLWPGQFVTVAVRIAVSENAIVAPAEAIQMGQSGYYAYVVKSDMTAEVRPVVPGDTWNNLTVVREGLHPEEIVVTDGVLRAAPGAKVRILSDTAEQEEKP